MKAVRFSVIPAMILLATGHACASQVPAHVYVALKALEAAPREVKEIVDGNLEAYLCGSSGPDIAYTTHYIKLGANAAIGIDAFPPGTEGHGDNPHSPPKSGELIVRMFGESKRDYRATAFVLGWLTHYCVDNVIHPLVNQHGGYYVEDSKHHKILEMMECEHVFQKTDPSTHDLYVLKPELSSEMPNVPLWVVNNAHAQAFTNGDNAEAYKPIRVIDPGGELKKEVPPPFVTDLKSSVENVRQASLAMLNTHRGKWTNFWASAILGLALKGPPPTPEEYEKIMHPVQIHSAEVCEKNRRGEGWEGQVVIECSLNDPRLLKLFCDAWDRQIEAATRHCVQSMMVWSKQPDKYTLPDLNLNLGPTRFDPGNAWPGKPNTRSMVARIALRDSRGARVRLLMPDGKSDWPQDEQRIWAPIPLRWDEASLEWERLHMQWYSQIEVLSRTRIWGGNAGRVRLTIPFISGGPGPYYGTVDLGYSDSRDGKGKDAWYVGQKGFSEITHTLSPVEQPTEEPRKEQGKPKKPEPEEPKPVELPAGAAVLRASSLLGDAPESYQGDHLGEIFLKLDAGGKITGASRYADFRKPDIERLSCNRIDLYSDFTGKITKFNTNFEADRKANTTKEGWYADVGEFEATGNWKGGKWLPGPGNSVRIEIATGKARIKGKISESSAGYGASAVVDYGLGREEWIKFHASASDWDKELKAHNARQPINGKYWPFPSWLDEEAKVWND